MDSARQVIRYAVPGAFGLLWGLASFVFVGMVGGLTFAETVSPFSSNVSAAIAIVGALPIGWACYQWYYYFYGPLIFGGRWVRRDRGGEALLMLTPSQRTLVEQLFGVALALPSPLPYVETKRVGWSSLKLLERTHSKAGVLISRTSYATAWRDHWDIVRALLNVVSDSSSDALKQECMGLADRYHGIGAARAAMWMGVGAGLLAGIAHALLREDDIWGVIWGGVVVLIVAAAWGFVVLHRVRRRTWFSMVAALGHGLRVKLALCDGDLQQAAKRLGQ